MKTSFTDLAFIFVAVYANIHAPSCFRPCGCSVLLTPEFGNHQSVLLKMSFRVDSTYTYREKKSTYSTWPKVCEHLLLMKYINTVHHTIKVIVAKNEQFVIVYSPYNAVPILCEFLSCVEHRMRYFEECWYQTFGGPHWLP